MAHRPMSMLPFLTLMVLSACWPIYSKTVDPTCETGLSFAGACCPKSCGQCGGGQCTQRSINLKTTCCPSAILKEPLQTSTCDYRLPPCRLSFATPPSDPLMLLPSISRMSATSGKWRIAPVKSGKLVQRHEACAVMVHGRVVLIGGRGVNKPTSIYNPKTKKWRTASGPGRGEQIHHFQCVAAGGSVWIAASWWGFYPFEKNNKHVYEYKVAADKWVKHPGMQARRSRGGAASILRGSLIFVVAGNRGGHGPHSKSVPWVDAFNWKTKKWLRKRFPDMPDSGRDHVGGAMVKGKMCIAGGRNGGTERFFRENIASVYCFDFKKRAWLRMRNLPSPRAGANTGKTCDGRMMVAGGEGDGKGYGRVDLFDGNIWKRGPNLIDSRHSSGLAFASCRKCGHVFIPSGSGSQGGNPELFTTEEYIPKGAPKDCKRY